MSGGAPRVAGFTGPGVEVRETHASWVLLAGDRALKIKKPVRFSFLDYSTLERRLEACRREVAVNAALAPGIYRGVRALVREGDALTVGRWGPVEDAVEYAVEMRRFDEGATMAARLATGDVSTSRLEEVARIIAGFHAHAPRCAGGGAAAFAERVGRDLDDLAGEPHVGAWRRFARGLLRRTQDELDARRARGLVRDGHGDLRAEHVVFEERVLIVDRIEFDDALRCTDVASDLAFLAMDLEAHGARWAAQRLRSAYLAAGADPGSGTLFTGLMWQRALVRLKVAGLAGDREGAERMRDLAESLAWRSRAPAALLVAGPPASGKSTLAAAVGGATGLPVVSSDVVRKQLLGLEPHERAGDAAYDEETTARTYRALGRTAARALQRDGGVIVDATLRSRRLRAAILGALHDAESVALFICEAPPELLVRRAAARAGRATAISDAGPAVAVALAEGFEPPDELDEERVCHVRTDRPVTELLGDVAAWLDR